MSKQGSVALGAIWFGAAVSVAEIEAGMQSGVHVPALLCGHVLGGVLLFAAGLIGARTGRNAMATTEVAFGRWGGGFFALLNVLQLVGWTAVMLAQGASAVRALSGVSFGVGCAGLATLVAGWLFVVTHDRYHLATVGIALLALLAVYLTYALGMAPSVGAPPRADFWSAFEISVAMPLSWLPLISDYTHEARQPVLGTATSAVVYTLVSIWMYAIGMLLVRGGATDLATGIVQAGLGGPGLAIVVFSTMTTTFLDANSSGESAKSLFRRVRPRAVGVAVCAVGGMLAFSGAVDRYVDFLCLIASVFAPMAAVLLVSHYVVRRPRVGWNFASWLVGTVAYQLAGASPIGPTLTSLLASASLALAPVVLGKGRFLTYRCGGKIC